MSSLNPRALDPDPDCMNADPDPGWFSEARASMERLTPKV